MNKHIIFCFILSLFSLGLSAQLRLNVQGNAAIQGNLSMGNPEANITGIDMLAGLNNLRFSTDNGTTEHMRLTDLGYLGIGTANPNFRLEVYGETQTVLGLTNTSAGGRAWSLYSLGASNGEGAGNFMIRDETSGNNRFFIDTNGNIGIGTISLGSDKLHIVTDANANYGARINNSNIGAEQVGVVSTTYGSGDGTRIGVYGRVISDGGGGQQYAVYGLANSTNASNITIGVFGSNITTGTGVKYAGYFNGDVTVSGVFNNPSDEKLKRNISDLDKAIERVMALRPVSYEFRSRDFPQMQLAKGAQLGFLAQEMEAVFPELVKQNKHPEMPKTWDENGNPRTYYPAVDYKGLNYNGLIPVLTKATQEQQEEIEKLETRVIERDRLIAKLEDRLARLEQVVEKLAGEASGSSAQTIPVTSADLRQNQPNPFTETTLIKYAIPDNVYQAELQITDVNGRLLKTIVIDQRGEGTTRLQAQSLSAGTYFYSLVLDGRALESKKMVLTK